MGRNKSSWFDLICFLSVLCSVVPYHLSLPHLFGWCSLLGQQNSVNVGQHTSGCNGDSSQQSVQFLIVLYGKGDVTRNDTGLLVVTSCVSSKFQNFGAKVFKNSSKVYRCPSSHTGCVLPLTQVTSDTTNGELQSCFGRCGGGFLLSTASLSFSYELHEKARCERQEMYVS